LRADESSDFYHSRHGSYVLEVLSVDFLFLVLYLMIFEFCLSTASKKTRSESTHKFIDSNSSQYEAVELLTENDDVVGECLEQALA
jgi:hypothetical protein